MSQQQTSQSSGQGLLERVFKLREHGTTARTEAIAGFTTFLTMVYIVFVNPQILGVAGMDTSAVFVTTCLIAAFGSIMMGLFANLPVALAPAMGLNAFFAFVVVQAMGLPWQVGMGAIFWGAVGLLLLTIFRVRYWMIANIPVSLRIGITSGIGLFIGMMGLKNAGVIVANPETLVSIGNLTSHSVLLGILGFFIIAILASRNIHAAVLVSIVVTTLLGWMLGDVHYTGIVSMPPSVTTVIGHVDLAGSLNLGLAGVIFSFMLVNLFDSSGTLIGVTDKAGLADAQGKFPRMKQALFVDSVSSVAGSFIGTSSVTAYIESSSGVSVGGRTGLTAVVVGLLFLLVIFLSPLAVRSARHYMKILEMLDAINQRYPDKVRDISACRWQIAKEGLGIIHTFDSMKDESKKHIIIKEFFDRGIWRLIWKNARTFRLRWRLGRRYLRIKRYRDAA